MSIGTIILIILVIALLGGFSGIGGGPFYGTGYYGGGGIGLVLVIVLTWSFSAGSERAAGSRHSRPGKRTPDCGKRVRGSLFRRCVRLKTPLLAPRGRAHLPVCSDPFGFPVN